MKRNMPRTILRGEQLLSRHMLTADLAVQFDPISPDENVDTEVTRVLRVFNHGNATAKDAVIQASLDEQLVDATWVRELGLGPLIRASPFDADITISDDHGELDEIRIPVGIGDINGDGQTDFGLTVVPNVGSAEPRFFLIFGQEDGDAWYASNQFRTSGELSPTELSFADLRPRSADWQALGDTDGDGFDDFSISGVIVSGSNSIASVPLLDVPSFPMQPDIREYSIGDLNGDGELDHYRNRGSAHALIFGSQNGASERLELPAEDVQLIVQPMGDINGDGFDDFRYGQAVAFGSASIEAIRAGIAEEQLLHVDANLHFEQAGDIDGDGLDDLVVRDALGRHQFLRGSRLIQETALLTVTAENTLLLDGFETSKMVPVGDLNNDGISDYADIGYSNRHREGWSRNRPIPILLSGGDSGAARVSTLSVPSGEGTVRNSLDWTFGGDVNGDGIDDLFVFYVSPYCHQCTASDRLQLEDDLRRVHTTVVLGSDDIGATDDFALHYHQSGWSEGSQFLLQDRNSDGVLDLVVQYRNSDTVVLGGTELASGSFSDVYDNPLNGENGFVSLGQPGALYRGDVNLDGSEDRILSQPNRVEIYLSPEPVEGVGNIQDTIDIAPGDAWVYRITGRLNAEHQDNVLATVSIDNAKQDVQLEVAAETSPVVNNSDFDQHFSAQLTIGNTGEYDASQVQIDESWTSTLSNFNWTITNAPFPERSREPAKFGPVLNGDPIPSGNPDSARLGDKVGLLGDINGDGFPEVYATDFDWAARKSVDRIFWGGRLLDESAIITGETGHFRTIQQLGDVNADGFDDFQYVDQIILGQGSFPSGESVSLEELNTVPNSDYAAISPAGDLDGDGNSDWISGDTILFGKPEGIIENGIISTSVSVSEHELTPIGDVNGDGKGDFVVSPSRDTQLVGFGRSSFPASFDVRQESHHEIKNAWLDSLCRGCDGLTKDFNYDGIGDFIFSDGLYLWVVFGAQDLAGRLTDLRPRTGEQLDAKTGIAIELNNAFDPYFAIGDFDNNGTQDIAVADWNFPTTIFGLEGLGGHTTLGEILADPSRDSFQLEQNVVVPLPTSVSDVTGDGVDDLLIGSTVSGHLLLDTEAIGQVALMRGRASLNANGNHPLSELQPIKLPVGATVTISISGVIPAGTVIDGKVAANPIGQFQLNERRAVAELTRPVVADLNSDGKTDFLDFIILSTNFGKHNVDPDQGDLNGDQTVDFQDFLLLSLAFEIE